MNTFSIRICPLQFIGLTDSMRCTRNLYTNIFWAIFRSFCYTRVNLFLLLQLQLHNSWNNLRFIDIKEKINYFTECYCNALELTRVSVDCWSIQKAIFPNHTKIVCHLSNAIGIYSTSPKIRALTFITRFDVVYLYSISFTKFSRFFISLHKKFFCCMCVCHRRRRRTSGL